MSYQAAENRYDDADLPPHRTQRPAAPAAVPGLWQNFGDDRPDESQRAILRRPSTVG